MKERRILLWTTLLFGVAPLWATTNDFIPGEGFNTLHLTPSGELRQILWRGTNLIYRTGAIGNWEEEVVTTTRSPVWPMDPLMGPNESTAIPQEFEITVGNFQRTCHTAGK
jgi:hypothetical protein